MLPTLTWQASTDAETGIKQYQVWLDGPKVAEVKGTQHRLANRKLTSGSLSRVDGNATTARITWARW